MSPQSSRSLWTDTITTPSRMICTGPLVWTTTTEKTCYSGVMCPSMPLWCLLLTEATPEVKRANTLVFDSIISNSFVYLMTQCLGNIQEKRVTVIVIVATSSIRIMLIWYLVVLLVTRGSIIVIYFFKRACRRWNSVPSFSL